MIHPVYDDSATTPPHYLVFIATDRMKFISQIEIVG